jgi:hypothetical protein
MTAEQRWILDLTEVLSIRLECARCGTAVTVRPLDWRDGLTKCPSCDGLWDRPHAPSEPPSPLQRFGTGLRLLLEQDKAAAKAGDAMPYRIKFEIHDPTASKYV